MLRDFFKKYFLYLFVSFVILLICGLVAVVYFTQKDQFDIHSAPIQYNLSTEELFDEFQNDPQNANREYLEQVLLVEGEIISLINNELIIGKGTSSVKCIFLSNELIKLTKLKAGDFVLIKGKCKGMGLVDVKMDSCILWESIGEDE